ncbi:transferase [Streptomyces ruber]|uniref:Transferase n=2 Tax=Streptomyces TaxID=1883 RepID=A0A918BIM6_9ACTN|nr:class I SAM-dependent methyltransferase [Streptomyces ruber]GGQ66496.1 transferase [Streptomyces ruber]
MPTAEPSHEPRRGGCPWCGSSRLRTRVRASFVVDECRECAHTLLAPRPAAPASRPRPPHGGHDAPARRHRAAARTVPPAAEPESWLDVGTGDGAFPAAAGQVHPYTCFDGLDPSPRVARARAAGRVEEAHQGTLADPEIVARLRGRYDVVSMVHHLEHTSDPRAELRAAPALLRPGGHLLVELWDPGRSFGAPLGRRRAGGGGLHLLPLRNVLAELEAAGCAVVATDRRGPHVPYDLTGALRLALAHGRPVPPRACAPLLLSAAALDHGLAPLLRRTRFSNAYRVLARRTASAP